MNNRQYFQSVKWRALLSGNIFGEQEEREFLARHGWKNVDGDPLPDTEEEL
jgi:hypothetical protein